MHILSRGDLIIILQVGWPKNREGEMKFCTPSQDILKIRKPIEVFRYKYHFLKEIKYLKYIYMSFTPLKEFLKSLKQK